MKAQEPASVSQIKMDKSLFYTIKEQIYIENVILFIALYSVLRKQDLHDRVLI
jgi:hypothetical protein